MNEIFFVIYLLAVFMFIFLDAMMCVAVRRRFEFWSSVTTSLIFPVSASLAIWYVARESKKWESTDGYMDDE